MMRKENKIKKLAIITTHPIQYNAPWFRMLAQRDNVEVKVFYTWSQAQNSVMDHTFGKEIIWDIPLLEGYDYEFIENVSKHPGSRHFFGIDCPSLIEKVNGYQPSAILFFGWNFKSYVLALHHFKGKIPVWFRGDSTLLNETGGIKTKLRRIILKKLYAYIDKAFYVGEANKDYFLKHGLIDKQLIFAPHAIDNERFENRYEEHQQEIITWRKELGYQEDDIILLFAGKFEKIKQPEFLIKALQKSNLQRSKVLKLLLVGNGPLEEHLKELASNDQNIQFLPFQNQTRMPLIYRLGDILCLPSLSETWGLAVNEAMACGRPVIVSSKVGCARDLVRQGHNGYIFSYDNIDELVGVFNYLTLNELHDLGMNALNTIQNYNFDAIVDAITNELYNLNTKNSS